MFWYSMAAVQNSQLTNACTTYNKYKTSNLSFLCESYSNVEVVEYNQQH